jgi:hypothetical protein
MSALLQPVSQNDLRGKLIRAYAPAKSQLFAEKPISLGPYVASSQGTVIALASCSFHFLAMKTAEKTSTKFVGNANRLQTRADIVIQSMLSLKVSRLLKMGLCFKDSNGTSLLTANTFDALHGIFLPWNTLASLQSGSLRAAKVVVLKTTAMESMGRVLVKLS